MGESGSIQVQAPETGATAPEPKQPEKILGKFENQEALAQAYTELEKKLGTPKTEEVKEELKQEETKEVTQDSPFKKFSEEYAKDGKLSDASYGELAKLGLDKNYVDSYIAGAKALETVSRSQQEKIAAEVAPDFGGREKLNEAVTWANQNWTQDQKTAFMEAYGKSEESARLALFGLKTRYQKEFGNPPKLAGGRLGSSGVEPFGDRVEMMKAMNDPRYAEGGEFYKQVVRRVEATNF